MSERTLRTLLVAVGALVLLYAIAAVAGRRPATAGSGGASARALEAALDAARRDSLDAVRIAGPGPADTIELTRAGGAWLANGFPADSAAVRRLREALDSARVGDLAAANPANHRRLGVAEDSTWTLELRRGGRVVAKLLVGKAGPTWPSAFLRLPGRGEVHVVHGDLGDAVRRPADEWRDRLVLRADTAAVRRIVVTRGRTGYALERGTDGRWTLDGRPADSTAVRDLLSELAELRADRFSTGPDSAGAEPRRVVALGQAGDTLADVRFAAAPGGGYTYRATAAGKAAIAAQRGSPFELPSWRADRLAPERTRVLGSGK